MGMLIMKSHCHPWFKSKPPSIGPNTKDIPQIELKIPSAPPLFSGGKISPMNALATGNIPPAPIPWMALPNINISIEKDVIVINEPIANNKISNI